MTALLIILAIAVLAYFFVSTKTQATQVEQIRKEVEKAASAELADKQRLQERQAKASEVAANLREHIDELEFTLNETRPKICSWDGLKDLKARFQTLEELTIKMRERIEDPNWLGSLKQVALNGRNMLYFRELDVPSIGQIENWINLRDNKKLQRLSELINWCLIAYDLLVTCLALQLDVSEMNTDKEMHVPWWNLNQQLHLEKTVIALNEKRAGLYKVLDRLNTYSNTRP